MRPGCRPSGPRPGPSNLAWGGPAPILYQALWNRRVDQVRCGPSALEPGEDGPLMIIDLHTHVWTSLAQLGDELAGRLCASPLGGSGRLDASPAGHDRSMSCVDGSMVLGFRSDRLGARIPNEFIAEFASKDPRRRVGVAGVDPMSDDALDQVERTVGLGLVGVTVSPACQGFHPAHSAALRVYERCEALSLPLFVTQGVPAGVGPGLGAPLSTNAVLEFARPGPWDEVARAFPNLPIVIGQLGYPWIDETLVLLGKHRNVYADISGVASRPWQLYNALVSASSLGVMDKLLFGSGFPGDSPVKVIEALYSVNTYSHGTHLPSVPRSLIRGIVERDSLSCLGIDSEICPRQGQETPVEEEPLVTVVQPRTNLEAATEAPPAGPGR